MTSPAEDFKSIISAAGHGSTNPNVANAIFIGHEPESPSQSITLFDTGGVDPNAKHLLDFNTVQVRVRGAIHDYSGAYKKSVDIKDSLLGFTSVSLNGKRVTGVWANGDIIFLKYDDNNRPIFVSNWRTALEPSTSAGSNRNPLSG